jgi:2'-5' RNA ligase
MEIGKYFLAIVLPSPSQNEVMALKEYVREHFDSKAALRSPAHITLHMPFEWKLKKEDLLIETLHNFHFSEPVQIELKNFDHFEDRVIYVDVVPNQQLDNLQRSLVLHVKQNLGLTNEADNRRGFHPHATIAFRDLNKAKFREAWAHFQHQTYHAIFETKTFHLLKHTPGRWEVFKEFNFTK